MAAVSLRNLDTGAAPGGPEFAAPTAAGYEVTLLPRFGLAYDGEPLEITTRSQRVLALLALERSQVRRSYVAGTLWPDGTEERASASLRSALWMLPRGLPAAVVAEGQGQYLCLSPHARVDYHAALDLARFLVDGGSQLGRPAADEPLLWSDLLTEWSEDWLLVEQERFRQMRLHALEALSARLTEAGMTALAIQAAIRAVAADPLRESANRALIRAHVAEGNLSEAVRQSQLFERLLREELGIEPSAEFRRLRDDFLTPAAGWPRNSG